MDVLRLFCQFNTIFILWNFKLSVFNEHHLPKIEFTSRETSETVGY